jgi:hypothetical protein
MPSGFKSEYLSGLNRNPQSDQSIGMLGVTGGKKDGVATDGSAAAPVLPMRLLTVSPAIIPRLETLVTADASTTIVPDRENIVVSAPAPYSLGRVVSTPRAGAVPPAGLLACTGLALRSYMIVSAPPAVTKFLRAGGVAVVRASARGGGIIAAMAAPAASVIGSVVSLTDAGISLTPMAASVRSSASATITTAPSAAVPATGIASLGYGG